MPDIESNINVNINAAEALSTIKSLQREISTFHAEMSKMGAASQVQSSQMQSRLVASLNATGNWSAQMTSVASTTSAFNTALEKNKLSMGEYFRYAGASTQTFGKLFKGEFDTINKVARESVKDLQTQYIKLGRDANGTMQSISVRPTTLDMGSLETQTAMAAARFQTFGKLVDQGSTNLLNLGKNTQWAGRQLMVGFTLPLAVFGGAAASAFMDIEKAAVQFKRVYGDALTPASETNAMTQQIKDLASAYTQYGVSVSSTMNMAASAAAMGKTGKDLTAQVDQTAKLSVLGGIDQQKSLETITSLTNTFGIATKDLSTNIDFLNAVENQTVLSIDDMTTAIPIAAPVVAQLGGNVRDLTVMLTAMKEGGIDASEGANALKSGLASLINPTTTAVDALGAMGVNLTAIRDSNKGNAAGMISSLATELDKLDPLNRAQAIEQLFGKFQFARMSTLLENINKQGGQAAKALALTKSSAEDLAALSSKELGTIAASPAFKFQKAIEDLKVSLAPIGETFIKLVTPIMNWGISVLNMFNSMSDGGKTFVMYAIGILGVVVPVALMLIGLFENGIANLIKFGMRVLNVGMGVKNLASGTKMLGDGTTYMSQAQRDAEAAASSLDQVHQRLIQRFSSEREAVDKLVLAYQDAIVAQGLLRGAPTASSLPGNQSVSAGAGIASESGKDIERSHLTMPFDKRSKVYKETFAASPFSDLPTNYSSNVRVLSNLVAELPKDLNQGLKKGVSQTDFESLWNSRENKLGGTVKRSGLDIGDPEIKAAAKQLEGAIRDKAIALAKQTAEGKVNDDLVAQATKEVIQESRKEAGALGKVALGLEEQAAKAGQTRISVSAEQARVGLAPGGDLQELANGDIVHKSTGVVVRRSSGRTPNFVQAGTGSYTSNKLQSTLTNAEPSQATQLESKRAQEVYAVQAQIDAKTINLSKEELAAHERSLSAIQREKAKKLKAIELQATTEEKIAVVNAETLAIDEKTKTSSQSQTDSINSRSRLQKVSGLASGVGMAAGMVGMGISSMGGPMADIMAPISGVVTTISSMGMAMSMLPGPIGLVVAGLIGLIAGIGGIVSAMDSAKKQGEALAAAMSATTEKINGFGVATGTTSISAQNKATMDAKIASLGTKTPAQAEFGTTYIASDAGKAFLADVTTQLKSGKDIQNVAENIASQLATGVAQGVLSKPQADSIATSMGISLNNAKFGINVQASLTKILGPNGEDLAKDPLKVTLALTKISQDQANIAGNAAIKAQNNIGINSVGPAALTVASGTASVAAVGATIAGIQAATAAAAAATAAATAGTAAAVGAAEGIGAVAGTLGVAGAANFWNPVGWGLLAAGAIAATVGGVMLLIGVQAESAKQAALAVGLYGDAYKQNIGLVDVINNQYDKQIATKKALADAATTETERKRILQEIVTLENDRATAIGKQNTANKDLLKNANETKTALGSDTWNSAIKDQIGLTYKDNAIAQEQAKNVNDQLSKLESAGQTRPVRSVADAVYNRDHANDAKITDQQAITTLQVQISSGVLDPTTAATLLTAMSDPNHKSMQTEYTALLSAAGDQKTVDMIASLSAMGADQNTMAKFINITANATDPGAEVKRIMDLMDISNNLKSLNVNIDINTAEGQTQLDKIQKGLNDYTQWFADGKNVQEVQTYFTSIGFGMTNAQLDYYNALPKDQQKVFTTAYLSVSESINLNSDEGKQRLRDWSKGKSTDYSISDSSGPTLDYKRIAADMVDSAAKSAASAAPTTLQPAPDTSGAGNASGGSAAVASSNLDTLISKLRQVQMASAAVTAGWAASRTALDNIFPGGAGSSPFDGLEQQMRRLGAKEDLITMIAGMDPAEFEKRKNELFTFDGAGNITGFRESLMSIGAAMRSIAFGTFQSKQQATIATINDQMTATRKLVAAGYSYAQAMEITKDAALASAIAQEADANIIKGLTADYAAATTAAKNLAAAQGLAITTAAAVDKAALASKMAKDLASKTITRDQATAILADTNLQQLYLNPNFDPATFQAALQTAADATNLQLKIDKLTISGMETIFQDGFNKAMEAFSAQQKAIEIKFAVNEDPLKAIIKNAQQAIQDINQKPGGLNDLNADLQRISDKEKIINDRYAVRQKALDSIKQMNAAIVNQNKAQLTIADALTQGDISGAAKAIQDARAQAATDYAQSQQQLMDASKQTELDALTASYGMTRKQLESAILDLKTQVFNIEQNTIAPAQYRLDLLERTKNTEIESLTVLGKTKAQWEAIKNRIDVAKTSSDLYTKAMNEALGVVKDILTYWTEAEKPKATTYTITTVHVDTYVGGNIGASGDGGSGSGSGSSSGGSTTDSSTPVLASSPTAPLTFNQILAGRYASAYSHVSRTSAPSVALVQDYLAYKAFIGPITSETPVWKKLNTQLMVMGYNTGGLVNGTGNTDKISAMLTPGEFVITKPAVAAFGASNLANINSGKSMDSSVYNNNYSVVINAKSDSSPQQIANAVMDQIKQVNNQRIRGNSF